MRIDIITIFPELFASVFDFGMIQKAWKLACSNWPRWDLRQFTTDSTARGRPAVRRGEGMVLKPELPGGRHSPWVCADRSTRG